VGSPNINIEQQVLLGLGWDNMSDTGNLIIRNEVIVDAVSMTADFTSEPQDISSTRSYSIQAVWEGATNASSADTFTLEASLDNENFTTISSAAVDTEEGTILMNVEFPAYPYIQVSYDQSTTSAGTMTVKLSEKI
jgi:hypothetical protein